MKKRLLFFLFALSPFFFLNAQDTGSINGYVYDAETGETLIGVNVVVVGTTKGTATNFDGYFEIDNLEAGIYDLKISYLAFQTQIITGIEVKAGEIVSVDVVLHPETEVLEDVVITADAILDSEAGLLRQRQKSISFTDAISAEAISNSGSSDAAGALKKVVGASVVDGKYVFIRGLGDRYTSTHLNGSELPSADPDRKSFQLDIFPANLLENIVTLKTFTPDKPGNFSGGLIDISTKDFPERFSFQLSASTGYNSQTSFNNIILGNSGKTDFLGFDNGSRDVPKVVQEYLKSGKKIPTIYDTRNEVNAAITLDELSKAFNNEFRATPTKVPVNQSYSFSLGNKTSLFGRDLGYTASLTYGQSYSGYSDGITSRYDLIGSFDNATALYRQMDVNEQKGTHNVDLGGMASLSYRLHPNHSISAKFLKTQNGTNQGSFLQGYQVDIPDATFQTRTIKYVERSLSSIQLSGKSYLPELNKARIEWKGSYALNSQDEPDLRYFTTQVDTFKSGNIVHSNPTNNFPRPGRFFRNLDESNYTTSVDISLPFTSFNGSKGNLKFGGNYVDVHRKFRELRFDIYSNEQNFSLNDVDGNEQAFFDSMGIIGYGKNNQPLFGNYIQNASTPKSNYDADRTVSAAYLMGEVPATKRLKLVGGFRFEHAKIHLVSQDTTVAEGKLNDFDILPSLNVIYELSDNMNLRAAYSKTVARPTFRELAPYITFDFVGDLLFQGNADLKRTSITNYDLRWEYYPSTGEVIAISGFYKDMMYPLERVIRTDIGNDAVSIQNVDRAKVYGVEFELRKNLGFLLHSLRHFSLSSNFTFVASQVDIPEMEMQVIRQANPDAKDTRELQGQSPFLLNVNLGYSNPDLGFNTTLSYNLFGDRQYLVTEGATPDIYERGYGSLGLTANKNIGAHFEVNLKASNLLNPEIVKSQMFKDKEFLYHKYRSGRTISFGIKYKI